MNKTIVITGATGSVGNAAVKELARIGKNDLLLAGRSLNKLKQLQGELRKINPAVTIEIVEADLSSLRSVKNAIQAIRSKTDSLAGIINVAAIYKGKRTVTVDNFEAMFATNHLGPFLLTTGLLDLVKKSGGKIVTVSAPSFTKLNFDDLQGEKKFSAFNTFGGSKMANLLFTFALARRLEGTNVTSMAFHPGIVKSELTSEMPGPIKFIFGLIGSKADHAGATLAQLAVSPESNSVNGKFFDKKRKELKKPGYSGVVEMQEKLWTVSEQLLSGK